MLHVIALDMLVFLTFKFIWLICLQNSEQIPVLLNDIFYDIIQSSTFLLVSNRILFVVGSKRSLELYFDTIGGEHRILRRFEFQTIVVATENFSETNLISPLFSGLYIYKVYVFMYLI